MRKNERVLSVLMLGLLGVTAQGCYTSASNVADQLNPYADPYEELGQRDTNAISGGGAGKKGAQARHALEVMGTYRQAQMPQPVYPVIRPAEVRLMWVPDHLNRFGDLVPAHYYYLRVLNDTWNLQDAFDNERQLEDGGRLNPGGGGGGGGGGAAAAPSPRAAEAEGSTATPWVYKDDKR